MRHKGRYAAIGYVTSKFVLPIVRRQVKRSARRKARSAVTGTANAARSHPARTSVGVGAAIGAIGWLVTRTRDRSEAQEEPAAPPRHEESRRRRG